jgi:hypothetical protein
MDPAESRALTVTAHILKNSAAAPCTSAFRPYRPRAATLAGDSPAVARIGTSRPP